MLSQAQKEDCYLLSLGAFQECVFIFNEGGFFIDYKIEHPNFKLFTSPDNFTGKHYAEFFGEIISQKIDDAFQRLHKGEKKVWIEYSIQTGGQTYWYESVIFPYVSQPDHQLFFVSSVRDITVLREKETLLEGILSASGSGIMAFKSIRSEAGNIIDFEWLRLNDYAEKIVGYSSEQLVGKRLLEIMPANRTSGLFDKYVNLVDSGEMLDHEHYYDGEQVKDKWFHSAAVKFGDGFVITFTDITEKKRAHLELESYKIKLSSVIENFQGGIILEDQSRNILLVNHNFCELFSIDGKPEQLAGKSCIDTAQRAMHLIEEPDTFVSKIDETIDHRQPVAGVLVHMKNGKVLERDYKPIYQEDAFLGHLWVYRDVTSKIQYERTIKESEASFRHLAENVLDILTQYTPEGIYTYASPSITSITGYLPEEIVGNNVYEYIHPFDIPDLRDSSHIQLLKGLEVRDIECRFKCKDGHYIWLSTASKAITDDEGNIIKLQAISHDITHRMNHLKKLEELNRQKTKLLSVIAHDLRGPVASSIGLLNLANIEAGSNSDSLNEYLALLSRSVFSLKDLLDHLLVWSRSQFDKVSFLPEALNAYDETQRVIEQVQHLAVSKTITVHNQNPASLILMADRNMFELIIRNLVTNAIKFTNKGGEVWVRSYENDHDFIIEVQDNGIGIAEEDQEKIFSTLTYSTYGTLGEKGTGLGLDLCRDFVEKHGGRIWVESRPDQGSIFRFSIPKKMPEGIPADIDKISD